MALADAVLAVAEAMEDDAAHTEGDYTVKAFRSVLRSFARELRTAVKASEGTAPATPAPAPQLMHRELIEKARAEFAGKIRKIPGGARTRDNLVGMGANPAAQAVNRKFGNEKEGEVAPRAVAVAVAGTGVLVDVPGDMPVGARTEIVGKVHELRVDGKLHPVEGGK